MSDWWTVRLEHCWAELRPDPAGFPLRVKGPEGRGLRRGGIGEGRMRGGGCCSVDRGCKKRACCWSGGGWRCREGVAGREGRRRGGGWWREEEEVLDIIGVWAEDDEEAAGDAPNEVTWPCMEQKWVTYTSQADTPALEVSSKIIYITLENEKPLTSRNG